MDKDEFKQSVIDLHHSIKLAHAYGHIESLRETIASYAEHDPVLAQLLQNDLDNVERVEAHLNKKLEVG